MTRIAYQMNFAAALAPLALAASIASGASSITNSLTGFTGNSTQAATQSALAAVGLGFTSITGMVEEPPGSGDFFDPTVNFSAAGASFGELTIDFEGRNFIRTSAADYANHSFTAEVTWTTIDLSNQAAYFGVGSAEFGSFRIADWETQFSAAQLFLEVDPLEPEIFTLKNDNGNGVFNAGTAAPGLDTGTNRLRLSYDWFRKNAEFAIDVNYAGGAFVADVTAAVNTLSLYGADGWPNEASRFYFGGDDGSVFKDLQITVTSPAMRLGDFNSDSNITSADWVILRTNQLGNFAAMTFQQAYFLGDLNGDKLNNHADFAAFKALYDEANGVGAFVAMLSSVPEPTAAASLASAVAALVAARRPWRRRK